MKHGQNQGKGLGNIAVRDAEHRRNIRSQIFFIRTIQKFGHHPADHLIPVLGDKRILFISEQQDIKILDHVNCHQPHKQRHSDLSDIFNMKKSAKPLENFIFVDKLLKLIRHQ